MKAIAVIGMNFGDEGKGHITNFLSNSNTLNIRFNGGAQAAHAVFLADGTNHIFKHFGSGSLSGSRTMFGSHFIINPIFFGAEWSELSKKIPQKEVFVDPRCRISTIYDMLINEFSSKYHKKNDTTGFGINETVERSKFKQLKICVRDLIDKDVSKLSKTLKIINKEYIPWRLNKLLIPESLFRSYANARINNMADDLYLNMIRGILKCIYVWPEDNLIDKYLEKSKDRQLVFEGGQGLLLDQKRKEFMPYLTRSSTGLRNIFDCLRTVQTSLELDIYLVTRTYLTRHGDGPLWNEINQPYNNVIEETNETNQYQGKMRYGYLNKSWYDKAIKEITLYIEKNKPKCLKQTTINTAFTCFDHLDRGEIIYSVDGNDEFIVGNIEDFSNVKLVSNGKTENCISKYHSINQKRYVA